MASGAIAFANEANDNIVTASATEAGFGGPVTVTLDVDVAAQSVVGVAIEGDAETPEKGGKAIEVMQQAMLEIGSIEVDGVSGASVTSEAIQGLHAALLMPRSAARRLRSSRLPSWLRAPIPPRLRAVTGKSSTCR